MATQDTFDPYSDHKPATGSGNFFALEDGETARIRIQSEPYIYRSTFTAKDGTSNISTRYAWLIYNHDEKRAQVLKMSATFFSQLAGLSKDPDYGDPTGYDLKVTRNGTGTDTKYQLIPAPKSLPLDDEAKESLAALSVPENAKEDVLLTLRAYAQAGNKFPEGTVSGSGDSLITELPDNPLNNL